MIEYKAIRFVGQSGLDNLIKQINKHNRLIQDPEQQEIILSVIPGTIIVQTYHLSVIPGTIIVQTYHPISLDSNEDTREGVCPVCKSVMVPVNEFGEDVSYICPLCG